MLPTGVIGVGGKPGEPLRDEVKVGVVVWEMFIAAATTDGRLVDDVERPAHVQHDRLAGLERSIQIDPRHGVVDGEL